MMSSAAHQADPHKRARLRWRARRGLLENDILVTRFLERHESTLTDADVGAFDRLLDLPDNELLDLILARTEPPTGLASADVERVLGWLRAA